ASNVGFDWNSWEPAWTKLDEELLEFKQALETDSSTHQREEFGDLLFSLVNVGRLLNLKAEDSLRSANRKFERRFRYIEKRLSEKKQRLEDTSLEEMDQLWDEAKENDR
ncbi:MAG: MazG nucleotide pyrophosphohydrolase domain-containing protein, partial [Balneolaceae bacterium]